MRAKQLGTVFSIGLLGVGIMLAVYGLLKTDDHTLWIALAARGSLPSGIDDATIVISALKLIDEEGTQIPFPLSPSSLSLKSLEESGGLVLQKAIIPEKKYHSIVITIDEIRLALTSGSAMRTIIPTDEFIIPLEKAAPDGNASLISLTLNPEESFFLTDTGAWIALPALTVEYATDVSVDSEVHEPLRVVRGAILETESYESTPEGVMEREYAVPDGFMLSLENGSIAVIPVPAPSTELDEVPSLFATPPVQSAFPQLQ